METHAFGFRLSANAREGQKRFPISRLGLGYVDQRGDQVLTNAAASTWAKIASILSSDACRCPMARHIDKLGAKL